MDVFLMVRRKKTTIFLDAKETTLVIELKKMIAGILKVSTEDQRLYYNKELMDDSHYLSDYNLNASTAKAQCPAEVHLTLRDVKTGKFEAIEITPLSTPPELPDVMKSAETGGNNSQHVSSDSQNA
ncbi:RNA polymerase II transcription elongation factor-like protein [Dinothrombium tinctorium]|uniref:RNA polymerase II transcription elongation factor-like protein n=1 Tax=Dinothrombium tinctorium TaxID=1965070 RepID=A0A3S3PK67_9ACAR|nr:RNA polymerase II transcription elongation factor-like protein [Dinothrombium tinctorium]